MKYSFKNLILPLGLLFFLLAQTAPIAFSQSNVTVDDVGGLTDIRTTNTAGGPSGEVAPAATASGPTQAGLMKDIQNLTSNLGDIAGVCSFEHLSPWSWNLTLGGCVAWGLSWLVVPITGSIFYLAATVFNWMVFISLDSASFLLQSGGIGLVISNTWTIFRDLANMFFIFVVIYIGISTMLDLNLVNTKKQLVRVITIAILINFSLVVTRIVIDASNVAAYGFYDAFPIANPTNDPGLPYPIGARNLATPFMDITSVTRIAGDFSFDTWVKESQEKTAAGKENSGTFVGAIVAILMVAIVQVVGSFVLFAAAILFLNRFMIFIILMITSPIAFICFSTPKLEGYWKKWWDSLLKNAFFAPIFLALYYVAANIFIGSHDTQIFTSVRGNSTSVMSFVGMLIIQFSIAVGFMVIALTSARSLGIRGAGTIVNWGNNKRKNIVGMAGRNTIGRAGTAIAESNTMKKFVSDNPRFGNLALRPFEAASKGKYGGNASYPDRIKNIAKRQGELYEYVGKDKYGKPLTIGVTKKDDQGNIMYDEAGAAIQEQVSTQEVFANNTGQARPESAWGRIKQLRSSREAAKAVQAKHGKATEKTKSTQKIKEEIGSIPDKIQNAQNELGKTETEIQTLETKGDLNAAETAKLTHLLTKKDRLSEKVEALEIRASDLQRQIDNANQMDSLNTAMAKQADKDK
jgi:hypothetical protein